MKNFILSHKRWQQIFDVQLLIALIGIFLEVPSQNKKSLGILKSWSLIVDLKNTDLKRVHKS